ncbi:glutamine--fructose-6-phosphate transaminase (isomerizing) [Saccharolobus solfataricus]|uniref:glutamine--fructose-6-phosphate transaminase (isomerizing) n=3 Tax=Saccharolobus solfataricus TaxID=2287 RepID=Q97YQ6_SACS2|nr:glutamine--fructose-6-phosphate transaminase (isomerizing) [Saccharolobus solfataricus]AAK41505.1 Glutamine-fructose-6-phosphate transaminase (isomerizing) (glmS-2) [Saccharolobus solfataricus P2]AKA74431.1 glutamine--fructose-6-phosphate transaminase (isomerizing) [Saccharolobus solfataricus]AKA77126.1 glutamine--fructose-6-phosphate transaminase (isomerizing) [Saccharolobus solfataricus]AKA79819.1 glutamine--fructose-6-phosphate transaminase (isomerizing) [Saccharolobus solfataricus]AZF68
MGGIFAFVCKDSIDVSIINKGLKKLIYRGYDSAGIAYLEDDSLVIKKILGNISKNEISVSDKARVAIGHTRYASRGWPTLENAHPLTDCNGKIAVVMDGILDDYEKIREDLIAKGHKFVSTTDAEVIPHLLENSTNYLNSSLNVMKRVKGIYSLVFVTIDIDKIFAINSGQPLMIGITQECKYVSSDLPSLSGFAENAIIMPENTVAVISWNDVQVYNIEGNEVKPEIKRVKYKEEIAEKGGFPHFMLKEIYDIPQALINSFNSLMEKYLSLASMIVYGAKNVYIIGNGTSLHAGFISSYYFSEISLNVNVVSAAEFPYYALKNVTTGSVIIAISQSGETSDVIRSIKMAKQRGAVILGITNSVGSRLALESNVYLPITAGPEMAVPATKTFTSTIVVLKVLSLYTGLHSGKNDRSEISSLKSEIEELAKQLMVRLPEMEKEAEKLAPKLDKESLYISSSGINYPIALEGALKFKEASMTHAEGIQLGELLHGPIVLTNKGYPVILIKPVEAEDLYNKVIRSIKERGDVIVTVAEDGDMKSIKATRDLTPISNVIPLHLLAYKLGVRKGLPIDTPPGLVKAVIV